MPEVFSPHTVHSLFGMQPGSCRASVLEFFVHDIIKIFPLLSVIVFVNTIIRSHFPERPNLIMFHNKEFIGNGRQKFDMGVAMHDMPTTPGLIANCKVRHSDKPLPGIIEVKEVINREGKQT